MKHRSVSFGLISIPAGLVQAAALLVGTLPGMASAVTIDMVTVGDPGNAADTTGYGAVADVFQIGTYKVTIQQYADFLSAAAQSDPYGLYDSRMGTNLSIAGISRSGSDGSYTYSVIGPSGSTPAGASSPGNRPITYVNWFDAARFANWMHNGQGAGSTETGAYTLNGATGGPAPAVNPGAQFFVPTEDQWYKAAFYKGGGTNAGYWDYATQSDTVPGNTIGSGANQANYRINGTTYSVTQSSTFSASQNYLTEVGAFSGSPSAYGTFDQAGMTWEWYSLTDAASNDVGRRGGSWNFDASFLPSSVRVVASASSPNQDYDFGIRLAAVPEPSTCVLALAGLVCGGYSMRRRRSRA